MLQSSGYTWISTFKIWKLKEIFKTFYKMQSKCSLFIFGWGGIFDTGKYTINWRFIFSWSFKWRTPFVFYAFLAHFLVGSLSERYPKCISSCKTEWQWNLHQTALILLCTLNLFYKEMLVTDNSYLHNHNWRQGSNSCWDLILP